MKLINLVYEYDYSSVELLLVPNNIADNINNVVQSFFTWLHYNKTHDYWTFIDGEKTLCIGAVEFVHWLNNVYANDCSEKSSIVSRDSEYNPKLPTADF